MLSILLLTIFAVLVHGEKLSSVHRNQTLIVSSAPDQNVSVASEQTTSVVTSLSDRSATDTTPDLVHTTAAVTSTTSGGTTTAAVTTSLLQNVAKTDVNETFSHNIISTNRSSVTTKEGEQDDNGQTDSHSGISTSESSTGPVTESCIGEGCAYRLIKRIPLPQTVGGSTVSSLLTIPTSPALETRQSVVPSTAKPTSVIRTTTTDPSVNLDHQVPVSSSSIGSNVGGYETTTSMSSNVEHVGQVSGDVGMVNHDHQEPISSSSIGSNVGGNEATTLMSFNDKTDDLKLGHSASSKDANLKHEAVSDRNEMSKTLFEHPQSGFSHLSLTDVSILGVFVGFAVAVLVVVIVVVLKRQGERGEKKMTSLNKETRRIDMRALRRNTINDVKASLVGIPSNGDIWLEMNSDSSIVV
ncbi:uncharacterized protein LOC124267203 [Haliotis rubra]|uniref:uncharacterized protein LOC124267203 n=1 Tax=Haliotis rubra TaxID=36100 RepID=UPI001EE50D99|nr:uncharacterized protein LOC124267203 [Haliotis rubra]